MTLTESIYGYSTIILMAGTTASLLAREIAARLKAAGFAAYLVGGCVRDLLLGREPKDFDVSTDATPDDVLRLYPLANRVGAHFGVVLVRDAEAQVEVATFRSDHSYADGRHPGHVQFERDPREDVLRRDFTINALLLDPAGGQIIDYVGGREDLKRGVVRAIGDPERRFAEDHLRMLRAIRFAARLEFTIDFTTMAAIRKLHSSILRISPERIRDELIRILTEGGARRGFELFEESRMLDDILPEVAALKGVEQPPEYHPEGDVWTHTMLMLEQLQNPATALAFGVLLHDIGKPGTFRRAPDRIRFDGHVELGVELARGIMRRFHFSNADCEQVLALVANHMKFKDVPRMKESTLKRFLRMPRFDEHLELHRLDCLNSNGHLDTYEFVSQKRNETPPEELKPPRLITGDDLIHAGYRPGPRFSEILQAVEDAQLEGRIKTREEALELAARAYPRTA
jgi:putative nucleotidyltransferase with HDIG domain